MVNGVFNLAAGAADLAFQRRDARVKFDDREPVEVLADQLGQNVVGTRRGVVIHGRSVDRGPGDVNNRATDGERRRDGCHSRYDPRHDEGDRS